MLPLNAYFRLNNLGRNSYKDKKTYNIAIICKGTRTDYKRSVMK